jgi:hypothetical protein
MFAPKPASNTSSSTVDAPMTTVAYAAAPTGLEMLQPSNKAPVAFRDERALMQGAGSVVAKGVASPSPSSAARTRQEALIRSLNKSEEVAVYLPQGATESTPAERLHDKTVLYGLEQTLKTGVKIDVVYVNVGSYQAGFYEGAEGRIQKVRDLLDRYGSNAKIAAWVESAVAQSLNSPDARAHPDAVYSNKDQAIIDPTEKGYFEHYMQRVKELASNPLVSRVCLDDEAWGVIWPDRWYELHPGVSPKELTSMVTGKLIDVIRTVNDAGKDSFYSCNGSFTSPRITNQGIDVYQLIDGGLHGLEIQAYRDTVKGFKALLDEIWTDLEARPETISKLQSFSLALSTFANDKKLPPEVRKAQVDLANEFLQKVKKEFGIPTVGVSMWPDRYTNYVTGESIRHPQDRAPTNER